MLSIFKCSGRYYTLTCKEPEGKGGVSNGNSFRNAHAGGQDRICRHVHRVLRGGRPVHRPARPLGGDDRPGAGRGYGGLRRGEAGGVLFPGPVPAGVPVRSGVRHPAHCSGGDRAAADQRRDGFYLHRRRGVHPGGWAVQDTDRHRRAALRYPGLVADPAPGGGHRRRGAAAGLPPVGERAGADGAAGRGAAGGGCAESVRGPQHGEDREEPAAGRDRDGVFRGTGVPVIIIKKGSQETHAFFQSGGQIPRTDPDRRAAAHDPFGHGHGGDEDQL